MLDTREEFRGVVVKSWVALPAENINFRMCNKILVREAAELCGECWRERCKALHSLEYEKNCLKKDVK